MNFLVSNFRPVELEGTFGSIQISKKNSRWNLKGHLGVIIWYVTVYTNNLTTPKKIDDN